MPAPSSASPAFIKPMLVSLAHKPPAGDGWLHEIKHDGNRTVLVVDGGTARAFTRNGLDWTRAYSRPAEAAAGLRCRSAVLDGEMIVQDERGLSDFEGLRRAIHQEPHRLVFYAFDLLHLDGEDLRDQPLVDRKARLQALLGPADADSPLQFSEALAGSGAAVFTMAERMGMEGIVSKRAGSRYQSGRSTAWLKTKCMTEGEFVVVGAAPNPGGPPFALLARETEGGLAYAGSAFVTLAEQERGTFWELTEELRTAKPVLRELRGLKASFTRPEMRVWARHLRGGAMLRHATVSAIL